VRASYLQIYNEVISDLLKPDRTNLAIREDKRRQVVFASLTSQGARVLAFVLQLMQCPYKSAWWCVPLHV
jgi:kinesin family protein 3/17